MGHYVERTGNLRGQGSGAAGRGASVCGRWRGQVELGVIGHHAVEADGHALDDGQQDGARYRAVAHRLVASSYRERAAGEESGDDGVPGVLLLPYSLDGAVVCVEESSPDAEVAAEYWRACLDGCDGADAALAVGRVAELLRALSARWQRPRALHTYTFHTVPYCSTDSLGPGLARVCGRTARVCIHPWQRHLRSH